MKKICKFSLLLLTMLIGFSQTAWANTYYYAKAKAQVSSKSNGQGEIYIGPAAKFLSADEAQSYGGGNFDNQPFDFADEYNSYGLEEGMPYVEAYLQEFNPISLQDLFERMDSWLAPATAGEVVIPREINALKHIGTAQPVYATYFAKPNDGYYLKGWSMVDNDVALGNANPLYYPVSSQAMTTNAEVKEAYVYIPVSDEEGNITLVAQPMSIYVAEGKSNRYLEVAKVETEENGEQITVYECTKEDGQYKLYEVQPGSGMHLYIPHRDNVTQHIYVINDDGERVDVKDIDGSYLTFPKDAEGHAMADVTYIIYKNPDYKKPGSPLRNYEFLPHRYNLAALSSCQNDACFQTTMLTPDFVSPSSTLLLVDFKTVNFEYNGYSVPAPAVVNNGSGYSEIIFLPAKEELPVGPTMYATFAPVQINGCTGGNIVNWSDVTDNTFNVTFSTSYASSTADFGAVTFDKQPDGGTYSAVVTDYNDNEVTIAVTFNPAGSLAAGEYKASMTLPSKGGESYVSCLVNVRNGDEANKAVSITINGVETKYSATAEDLNTAFTAAMSNPGAEVKLLSDLTLVDVTTVGNFTFDLDGWTLNLPDGNTSVAGTLLLKNGTVNGNVSIASTGNITVDGATINGTLTNAGVANLKRGTFNGGTAVSINNSGSLTLEKGAEVIAQYNAGVVMQAGSTGTVNGARFYGQYPIDLKEGANGEFNSAYFTQEFATEMTAMGMTHYDVTVGPAYEAGYTHLYAKDLAAAQAAGAPVCKIGNTGYSSLEDALLYAQNNPSQKVAIIMTNDYTLPAGWYTLPANASLLIPYQSEQVAMMGGSPKKLGLSENYERPYVYRTLTFSEGVHFTMLGSIEASSRQFINGGAGKKVDGYALGNAIPSGPYGWLRLDKGAEITMGNGSHLYAWGFVTGEGEIDVRRGGAVHEMFQVYDWPGGDAAINMVLASLAQRGSAPFPINQYFMQNVESQTTFHPGARMYCSFGATAAGMPVAADAIQIVGIEGDVAMFLMNPNDDADNTWVRKHYDIENDRQVWEVNSGAHLGSMVIDVPAFKLAAALEPAMAGVTGFDSRNFILPLTNNLKIHLLSGYMDITQNTELLPGAELEIDKESTMEVVASTEGDVTDPAAGFLYLIDKADWQDDFANGRPGQQILYSPSWVERGHTDGKPNVRNITSKDDPDFANSKVNVHGTFSISGQVMTTEHGGDIVSTNEDAGTIVYDDEVDFEVFMDAAASEPTHIHINLANIPNSVFDIMEVDGLPIPQWSTHNGLTPMWARTALLRNGVGSPVNAGGLSANGTELIYAEELGQYVPAILAPQWDGTMSFETFEPYETPDDYTRPGESFCYIRDRWTKMNQFNERFAYNNYNEWYIKPAEYVAIATEAMDVDGDYAEAPTSTQPMENPDHTYSDAAGEGRLFIWVESPSNGAPGQWWEVTLEDNLYKGKNGTYYEYNEDLELWIEHAFKITWLNWDGSPVLDHDDKATVYTMHYGDRIQYLGTYPSREENVDYTYNFTGWSPEITAETKVTGDATYMATYEAIQRKYTIIFLNENGTEIRRYFLTRDEIPVCEDMPSKTGYYLQWTPAIGAVTGDQEYRATFTPEKPTEFVITFKNYDGTELQSGMVGVGQTPACAEPTKLATSEYTYVFDGWNPAIEPVSQEMTYTAKFKEQAKEYAIRFFDENGVQKGVTQNLAYGVAPAIPNYTKPATAEYTYTTTWEPQVAAVTKEQDYTAVVTPTKNKYTVTINAVGCAVNGAGSYEYGTQVTLSLGDALAGYSNPAWEDGSTADKTITVTGDVTFVAIASNGDMKINLTNGGEDVTLSESTNVAFINIIAGEGIATSQLFGAEHIVMSDKGKAYFTYSFGNAKAFNWYAFAVPFKCDAKKVRSANGSTLYDAGTDDYDIVEYDGDIRSKFGPVDACWKDVSDILYPGKLYMIIFNKPQTSITFTGKDNDTYYYDNFVSVKKYPGHVEGDDNGNGWNGIANPALYGASISTSTDFYQVCEYDGSYKTYVFGESAIRIAKPFFVQAAATESVVVGRYEAPSSVAARRMQAAVTDRYVLNFGNDRVFLISDDEAEDDYVTGQDLAKFGVSTTTAQVWVNRYDAKLCVNHQASENGVTTFPLGVFAPKAGNYTLSVDANIDTDTQVLLMQNGVPVWNFQNGDCVRSFSAGTDNSYSICIKHAPAVTTGVEDVDVATGTEKIMVNGMLYILRDGVTYDAQGHIVK